MPSASTSDTKLAATLARPRTYVVVAVAGVLAGLIGTAFRVALVAADNFRISTIDYFHEWPWIGWIVPVSAAALAVVIARYIVVRIPEAAGSGVQRVEASVREQIDPDGIRVIPAKFVGGVLAIGSGMALGREGPTVQMAASIGTASARVAKVDRDDELCVQAALAGAGLGVAFNAPLGGAIFVIEELTKSVRMKVITLTLLATGTAVGVMRLLIGGAPDFTAGHLPQGSLVGFPVYLAFGFIVGIVGAFYSRTIVVFLDLFNRFARVPLLVRAGLVGALVGLVGWFAPSIVGGGDNITQNVLTGSSTVLALVGIIVVRWFLGPLSYSVATPGGLFAPLLVLGACLGALCGLAVNSITPDLAHPATFALAGMSALFAAVVRAPITGVVLVVEMTAISNQFVPIMIATAAAMVSVTMMKSEPIYDTLRHRLLQTTAPPNQSTSHSRGGSSDQ